MTVSNFYGFHSDVWLQLYLILTFVCCETTENVISSFAYFFTCEWVFLVKNLNATALLVFSEFAGRFVLLILQFE